MGRGGLLVMAEQQVTPPGQHCGGFCRPQLTAQPQQMGQGPHVPLPALPGDTLTFAEVCGEQGGHCKRQGGQLVPAPYPWHPKPYSTQNPLALTALWPLPLSPGHPKPVGLTQQLGPSLHPRDPQQDPATGSQQPPGDGVTRGWGTGHAEDASQLQQRSGDAQREQRGPWPRLGLLQQSVGPQFLLGGVERPLLQASLQLWRQQKVPEWSRDRPSPGRRWVLAQHQHRREEGEQSQACQDGCSWAGTSLPTSPHLLPRISLWTGPPRGPRWLLWTEQSTHGSLCIPG